MNWNDAENYVHNGVDILHSGVMSVEDAKRAVDIGCQVLWYLIMEEDNLMDLDHLLTN